MGYDDYKTQKAKELKQNIPYSNGEWNQKYLYEYLVQVNYDGLDYIVLDFFKTHYDDKELARILLQDFLLDDTYEGSESQIGAVFILRQMDKSALAANKELVLLAQQNEVYWKRPIPEDDDLSWLS